MQATFNLVTNPFHPSKDRVQREIKERTTVNRLVAKHKVDLSRPTICYFNGNPLLRKDWARTQVREKDVVTFIYLPQGGGGSNPLRIILMIALVAFAAVAAPAIVGTLAPGLSGTAASLATGLVKAGIMMIGSMLVNALIPPPKPPGAQRAADTSGSPTYTLGAQGNQARIGQAIPVIYGRHLIYPDYAAQPFVEFESNEQMLYQLFCIGQGEYAIDLADIKIEDTPISVFGAEVQIVPPGQQPTLFPGTVINVTEVSGQTMTYDIPVGPFTVNPATTVVNKIALDIICPEGLFYANDSGGLDPKTVTFSSYATPINDAGANTGPEFLLGSETITSATATAIRKTYKYTVPAARYKVRVVRTNAEDTSSRAGHEIVWGGARGYLDATNNYGNVTLVAVKMQAGSKISQQSTRRVNMIVTRKLPIPTWNPATSGYDWSAPTATQSIAWAIADACRATYGAGVHESRFDVAQLIALDAIWTARGDKLNGIFDSQSTFWDGLSIACRAGRARPYVQAGMIHFVRDSLVSLPTALFSNRNIVKGSMKVTYVMPSDDSADCVDVEYFDEVMWKPRVVRAALEGYTTAKPARVKAFGITNRDHAWREGMYIASSNRYRRKEVSFETELEGHIPSLGDLIAVQSDTAPNWGQSGEIVAVSGSNPALTMTTSEPLQWTDGATHYMMLRSVDGTAHGAYVVTRGIDDYTVHFSENVTATLNVDLVKERTHYSFGRSGAVIQLCRVTSLKPRANTVQINAINEDVRVHSADNTSPPADNYSWALTTPTIRPVLTNINVVQVGSGLTPSINVTWTPVAGATKYVVETSTDNQNWATLSEVTGASYSFLGSVGTLYVRVAAFGGVLGPWVTKTIAVGTVPPPPDVTSGSNEPNGSAFEVKWGAIANVDGYKVNIWANGQIRRSFYTLENNLSYTFENAYADGGPWRTITADIYAVKGGVQSVNKFSAWGSNPAPAAPTILLVPGAENIAINVSACPDRDYVGTMIYASTTPGFTPGPANLVYEGTSSFFMYTDYVGTLYVRAAHYDTYGKTGLNMSAEYTATSFATAGGGIQTVSVQPAGVYLGGDVVLYSGDDKLYRWDGAAYTKAVDGSDIQALSVTSDKISVNNLGSIKADLGTITAGNITLNNTGFIRGGATDYMTGTGLWMGYHSTTYKFHIGNPSGRFLAWSGTDLVISGTQFILSGGVATFMGTLDVKSAASGARMEIKNNYLKVFDDSGALRVQIGDLTA